MTREQWKWLLTRSTGFALGLGILWLIFGLLWVVNGVLGSKAGPLPWITATIGFVLSLAYFTTAWKLRRRRKASGPG